MSKRHIAILGATGSIGTQALDVVSHHPDRFEIDLLTANNNAQLLIEQALKFKPNNVVICNEDLYNTVNDALSGEDIKVFAGMESVNSLVQSSNVDIVLASMVGFSGLEPTINAIKAYRYAEEYKLISSEKLLYKYNWQSRGQKGIVGEASMGGFALDAKTINAFGADSEYADFDTAELSGNGYETSYGLTTEGAFTDRLWVIVGGTYYYDAFEYSGSTDIPHVTREINKGIADERVGAKAYAYKVYTGTQEKTVAGIQQGNGLVTDETLGPIVRDGVLTKEQVLSANTNGLIGGGVAFLLMGVVLVFLGIRKPKAKTKEA